jgi:hypothetical protein
MKNILVLLFIAISVSKTIAQANTKIQLTAVLECANPDNTINIEIIGTCKKLHLIGQGNEDFRIRAGAVLFNLNGKLIEHSFGGENLSDITSEDLKKLKAGSKIFIENITIIDLKTKETRKVPNLNFIVK